MITLKHRVLIDTREQLPWFQGPVPGFKFEATRATLSTGDYSLEGLSDRILIERKSLDDLVNCVGHGRERFQRELQRLAAEAEERWLMVEASRGEVEARLYKSRVHPSSVIGSLMAWAVDYQVQVWWAGSAPMAERDALRLLKRIENRAEQDEGGGRQRVVFYTSGHP